MHITVIASYMNRHQLAVLFNNRSTVDQLVSANMTALLDLPLGSSCYSGLNFSRR